MVFVTGCQCHACLLRCCIPGCSSTNKIVKLFKFPKAIHRVALWQEIIRQRFPDIKFQSDSLGTCQQYVCRLHFEDKYINPNGNKNTSTIPTLFSREEINSQQPLSTLVGKLILLLL